MRRIVLSLVLFPEMAFAGSSKSCVKVEDAAKHVNKDVCVVAHVYGVVELQDGTRFLDTCSPETPDELCRFTIVSSREDRDQVGVLSQYRDTDVHIRGIASPMRGRTGMMLSHARQFNGGPPKFKPNPKLLRGFGGEQSRPSIGDPNLRGQGGHRAFMNQRDQEPLATKQVK
jgi:hypothetical protein